MTQAFYILRKDLRHHWPAIVASLALLAAFCWYESRSWRYPGGAYAVAGGWFLEARFLPGLTAVLVPAAWIFLILRVVQDESLVGDRQFWVTRPYEWKSLLAAKILFLVVCINVPLLIADIFLLAKAGFAPGSYLAGLFWMQLLLTLAIFLPCLAMASITATVLQALLGGVIVVVYLIAVSYFASKVPHASFSSGSESLQFLVFLATCVVVVLVQYARRRTLRARLLVAGLGVTIIVIILLTPYRMLVDRQYPPLASGEQPPFRLGLIVPQAPPPPETPQEKEMLAKSDSVSIAIPFNVSGLADDSIMTINGFMVDIDGPHGEHWNSRWASYGDFIPSLKQRTFIGFGMKKDLFERWKNEPVRVRISLAAMLFRDADRREFVVPAGEFWMDEAGWCTADQMIHCRTPLRRPRFLFLRSPAAASTCPHQPGLGENEPQPNEVRWGETHNLDSDPADFGISPVKELTLYLSSSNVEQHIFSGTCPGTPLVLSKPQLVRAFQTGLQLDSIRLDDYRSRPRAFLSSIAR